MVGEEGTGLGRSPSGRATNERSHSAVSPPTVGVPNAVCGLNDGVHPRYGPCDGFGPMWTCSECTGVASRSDGSFVSVDGDELSPEEAAARVGDYLLTRAEMAAVAAFGCCDNPASVANFMRASLLFAMPGQPWRHRQLFDELVARDSDTRPKDGDACGSTRE